MEPFNGPSGERMAHAIAERVEDQERASGLADQASEPFEATIVRLDQATAEEIFRMATR
jgi:hypothetical protein